MDIYKQGIKEGVRFMTTKGNLSIEQLFHLTQTDLANSIKNQKKLLRKTDEDDLGFLDETSKVDVTEQLKFDILKDVYLTKKADADALKNAKLNKEHNKKIMELIQNKKDESLAGKTIEELEKMLVD